MRDPVSINALGLNWNDRIEFVLAEDLAVKAIKYSEIVQKDAGVEDEMEVAARFDADFALMSMEIDQLCESLIEVFGIEED